MSFTISRRGILSGFGLGTLGLFGYSRFHKPQPSTYDREEISLPFKPPLPKRVAVVGGGLAGLSCAYELSRRGMAVTLLEKSPQLGGKIASWTVQVGKEQFQMEHGFHGFFPQYYNLQSVMAELGTEDNFRSLNFYAVMYRDGYAPEVFRPSRSAFPWNIVDLAIASPNALKWGLNLTSPHHWAVFREIAGFHPQKSYDRLDHLLVSDWVSQDFPKGLFDLYFLPFAKSSLNAPDRLSSAELVQFFHFYFFGNPEGLAFNGTKQDMGRCVVDPLANAIKQKGGTILTEVTIDRLRWEGGRIAGIDYTQGSPNPLQVWLEKDDSLASPGLDYYHNEASYYVLPQGEGEVLSLTCPHQGCRVQANEAGFLCPCHGAKFDRSGKLLRGPATRGLDRLAVLANKTDRLLVGAPAPTSHSLTADYYVMAADVVGMKEIFNRSCGDAAPALVKQVKNLAVADPFAVCRLWFDRDFEWHQSDFTSLSGYRLTDSITLYHRIQADYIDWAQRTGGSVVELHAYCYKEAEFPTQADLVKTFMEELFTIVPPLQEAKLLHYELVNQKNFSGYPPGSFKERPSTNPIGSNLFFAGDWVKMPFPCGLMERAVSSGLLAANSICQAEGLQKRTLYTVNPEGVLSNLA